MRRVRRTVLVLALCLAGALSSAGPAHAAPKVKLNCGVQGSVTLSPGLTAEPGASSFSGSGTVVCVRNGGTVYTGSISLSGSTAPIGTCLEGAGSGTFSASLTGVGAPGLNVTGFYSFLRTGPVLQGQVTLSGNDSGFGTVNGAFAPTPGQTCFTGPVTTATFAGAVSVSGQIV